jgi:hypothetical protein
MYKYEVKELCRNGSLGKDLCFRFYTNKYDVRIKDHQKQKPAVGNRRLSKQIYHC